MSVDKTNCANCEQPYEEGFEFCPHCGQKTNEELTIGVLFYNTISNYFSFDARFLKSFVPLMFRPGYLANKFLEGKRLLYLHPAQMYLFISVIFFFILSFSTREWVKEANELNAKAVKEDLSIDTSKVNIDTLKLNEIKNTLKTNQKALGLSDEDLKKADSIIKQEQEKANNNGFFTYNFDQKKVDSLITSGASDAEIYKEMGMPEDAGFFKRRFFASVLDIMKGSGAGSVVQKMFDTIPIAMFFLMPLFALILKIFYYRKGRYSHHLVFSFYFFSFLFTTFSILFGVNRFLYDIPDWITWLIAFSTYFYFLIALHRFYKQHWMLSFIKSGIISFVFLLFIVPTAALIILLLSFIM